MYTQRIRVRDLEWTRHARNGAGAYAMAKRGQVILAELWAAQLAGTGVVAHAMHPEWVDTPGVEGSLPGFHRITGPFLRTPHEGADTIVWLVAADEPGGLSGGFWHDRRRRPTHRLSRTREKSGDRELLWQELNRRAGWEPPPGWPWPRGHGVD